MTGPDPRRQAVIDQVKSDLALLVVELRAYATEPAEDIWGALYELPGPERVTVAQLAVALDQCGFRLRLVADRPGEAA